MAPGDSGTQQVAVAGWAAHGERRRRPRAGAPVLTILCHADVSRIGERASLAAVSAGGEVPLSRRTPDFAPPGGASFRGLADSWLSRTPILLAPGAARGGLRLSVGESPMRLLADGVPVVDAVEWTAAEVERGVVLELAGRVVLLLHAAAPAGPAVPPGFGLVGESDAILRVRRDVAQVADLGVPVLLRGETGTGKELAAEAVHRASRRRGGPFLAVNLAAVPAALAASELFGAARGAYTGAVQGHAGYFERAQGGTLFLDEIGDAPPEVQVSLLRVLEQGEIQRVGAAQPQPVDVRLVAGTDADLELAIAQGRFRAALLHRLAGYEIRLPPLRERRDDLGRLLFHFLRQELAALGEEHRLAPRQQEGDTVENPWMPASIVARLARCDWPGNVRQLRNVARQLAIDSRGSEVVRVGPQVEKLLREPAPAEGSPVRGAAADVRPRAAAGSYRSPAEVSDAEVLEALAASRWEVKPAAARLGISRPSLYVLMAKCPGVRKASDLSRAEILECRKQGGDLDAQASRLEVSKSGLLQRLRRLGLR